MLIGESLKYDNSKDKSSTEEELSETSEEESDGMANRPVALTVTILNNAHNTISLSLTGGVFLQWNQRHTNLNFWHKSITGAEECHWH